MMIANPPYGADIDELLVVLRPLYHDAIKNYADIYKRDAIQLGLRKIREGGIQVFITPNTFLARPRIQGHPAGYFGTSDHEDSKFQGKKSSRMSSYPPAFPSSRGGGQASAYRLADLSKRK